MKKAVSIAFLLTIKLAFCQHAKMNYLPQLDSSWTSEVFDFPLSFAPEIIHKGIEQAFFPTGWGDSTSIFFWSYIFIWDIKTVDKVTTENLEQDLNMYFNGLMNWANTKVILKKRKYGLKGKIYTRDSFFTKKQMILNVTVENNYDKLDSTSTIVFRLSPKQPDHEVWKKLKKIKLMN